MKLRLKDRDTGFVGITTSSRKPKQKYEAIQDVTE
jgi:hypothetical protein